MSISNRVAELYQRLKRDKFPTFRRSCELRWPLHRWLNELGKQTDVARVRSVIGEFVGNLSNDDEAFMRELREWPPMKGFDVPPGACPHSTDEAFSVMTQLNFAVRDSIPRHPPTAVKP